jgi:polyphosphate kinase 2
MADRLDDFDLDDPILPKSIKRKALVSGGHPYADKLDADSFEPQMQRLQEQLAKLQADQAKTGRRVVIVFEGRDAAGKGGSIKTYLQYLNPRFNMGVALTKPSDRERTQWYFQRYVDWLPAAGEQVLFDRSWYNRAGVEPVMGFCSAAETEKFLDAVPHFEQMLVDDGIHLFKFWLAIGREMQLKRFHDRRHDPLKVWKLSPVDLEALKKFDDYSQARDRMFEATDSAHAPWRVILNNDKRRGHLALLRSVLHSIDFEGKDDKQIGAIDDKIAMSPGRFMKDHPEM